MKQIEYIEATGTQYIADAFMIASGNLSYEIKLAYTVVDSNEQDIFGNYYWVSSASTGLTLCGLFDRKIGGHQYFNSNHVHCETNFVPTVNVPYVITGSASPSGQGVAVSSNAGTAAGAAVNSSLPFWIFRNGPENARNAYARLYYLKVWDNGTLIRDFVPALNGYQAGLYDRVNEQFYSNAGTGEFLYPLWYTEGDSYPTTDFLPELPENPVNPPFPSLMWRIQSGTNSGYPFHALLPNVRGVDIWALHRKSQIHVYPLTEPQNGYKSNGLAILEPTSCTSWHDADRWDVELVHPLDEWGKWKFLLPENVLKIRGQLFRIDQYLPKISGSERTVSVHATHITGDMVAQIIRQATFPGGDASDFIDFAFSSVDEPFYSEGLEAYTFEGYSDISAISGETELVNSSLWAAIVGADNCLLNRYGGELYRDNFYFSVCSRMQYAKDNAFRLRYSLDMTEISQTIDYSDFCTELHGRDNFGNEYAIWWNEGVSWAVHHPRQRAVVFNYSDFDTAFDNLQHDVETLFWSMDYPKVTYEMTVANLKNDPRYADFLSLQDYHYGDSGSIYCPELDIDTVQKITAEQRDELTGDALKMTLGNLKNSWVRPSLMAGTVSTGSSISDKQQDAVQKELKTAKLKALPDWKSARTYTWTEIHQFSWKEVKNHGN